jgi:hypothetical protein
MNVNFKQFYLKEFLSLSPAEKKVLTMGKNTGNAHHQRIGVGTNADRQKLYVVAKDHTRNKHEHPKVTECLTKQKPVALTPVDAKKIKDLYNIYPTPDEPLKAIKQTMVHMKLDPTNNAHILIFIDKGQ